MNRVYIGHNNDSTDMDYLLAILSKGVWMGLDRTYDGPSMPGTPDWRQRAETIKFLIDAGYGHRILVGHDTMVLNMMGGNGMAPIEKLPPAGSATGNLSFLVEVVLPYVRDELGATQEQIDRIVYDNPRRFFENKP
jgi:phosphotriesterase-related protein|eukprot:COSAG06_NODE_9918_length_1790_cov_1.188646_1_plen_136_part_00